MDLDKIIDRRLVLESDKAETLATIRLSIDHDGRINDFPILTKEGLECLISRRTRQATDKNLLGAMMLKAGNGALRINLW
jgi:hypothetical protein